MRWITFCVLAYLFAACQVARVGALRPAGTHSPLIEFLPLLAVFYALYAEEDQAALTGLWCGLLYDFLSPDVFGLNAVALALVCYVLVRIRMSIFREHMVSQFIVVLISVALFGVFSAGLRSMLPYILSRPHSDYSLWSALGSTTINALYTAALSPAIYWLLFRLRALLGFPASRGRNR